MEINYNPQPIISIITVVYNAEKFLQSTIDSVVKISGSNIKFIIIDGGSTDATVDIIKLNEKHIYFWSSEADYGIYDAFNKGWDKAGVGSYILYLGAGDKVISLPSKDTLNKADAIFGNVKINESLTFKGKVDYRLKLGNTIHHQALLLRKMPNTRSPFDVKYKTYADFDFNQRLFKEGIRFFYDENFISYALPGGVSQKFNKKESISIVRKNFGISYAILAYVYYFLQEIRKKIR